MSGADGDNANLSGDLDITADVVINGHADGTTIDGGGDGDNRTDRVLDIFDGLTVTLTDLTITGGSVNGVGGGIRVSNSMLALNNTQVTGNFANGPGGGIYNHAIATMEESVSRALSAAQATSIVTLNSSTVSYNQSDHHGGGIYNEAWINEGDERRLAPAETAFGGGGESALAQIILSSSSAVSNNAAWRNGGGIYSKADSGGTAEVIVTNSSINDNSTSHYDDECDNTRSLDGGRRCSSIGHGGGIYNRAEGEGTANVELTGSTVSNNTTFDGNLGSAGGGIYNYATSNEPRAARQLDGGTIATTAVVTLTDTAVSVNTARNGGGIHNSSDLGFGLPRDLAANDRAANTLQGGLESVLAKIVLQSESTVSDNDAKEFADGGGIYHVSYGTIAEVEVTNSTVSGNKASVSGGGIMSQAYNQGATKIILTDSSVINNAASYAGDDLNGFDRSMRSLNGVFTGHGGGIYNNADFGSSATLNASGSTISGNTTTGESEAVQAGASIITLRMVSQK